jgi:hypothetical protein
MRIERRHVTGAALKCLLEGAGEWASESSRSQENPESDSDDFNLP